MNIYLLKEVNHLSSGENGYYVEAYATITEARDAMKKQVEETISQNHATITWNEENNVQLIDENKNEYEYQIEMTGLKGQLRLEIDTSKGKLIAGKMTDPEYPGIWIDVKDPTDGAELSAVVVEYKPDREEIVVHAWREEDEGNDPVTSIDWGKKE